jgi:hypothetical protein
VPADDGQYRCEKQQGGPHFYIYRSANYANIDHFVPRAGIDDGKLSFWDSLANPPDFPDRWSKGANWVKVDATQLEKRVPGSVQPDAGQAYVDHRTGETRYLPDGHVSVVAPAAIVRECVVAYGKIRSGGVIDVLGELSGCPST